MAGFSYTAVFHPAFVLRLPGGASLSLLPAKPGGLFSEVARGRKDLRPGGVGTRRAAWPGDGRWWGSPSLTAWGAAPSKGLSPSKVWVPRGDPAALSPVPSVGGLWHLGGDGG